MFSHSVLDSGKQKWLVAFYGYGQSAEVYSDLYEQIKDTHNLLIIDNPMWDYNTDVYPKDLKDYIEAQLKHYQIESFTSFSYSMGGRLNLYVPLFFPDRLNKIILAAPDGITFNFWNRVAVSTPWGRRVFKYFVDNGKAYMRTLLFFHKMGIVGKSQYAFSKWNMRDDERRKNVYNAWMNMRFLRPNLNKVNEQLAQKDIRLVSYFGNHDPIITPAIYARCRKKLSSGQHNLIDADHNMLNHRLFERIKKELAE